MILWNRTHPIKNERAFFPPFPLLALLATCLSIHPHLHLKWFRAPIYFCHQGYLALRGIIKHLRGLLSIQFTAALTRWYVEKGSPPLPPVCHQSVLEWPNVKGDLQQSFGPGQPGTRRAQIAAGNNFHSFQKSDKLFKCVWLHIDTRFTINIPKFIMIRHKVVEPWAFASQLQSRMVKKLQSRTSSLFWVTEGLETNWMQTAYAHNKRKETAIFYLHDCPFATLSISAYKDNRGRTRLNLILSL